MVHTPTGLCVVNVPCKSRGCTLCIENIVGAKMELMLSDDLYVWEGTNQDWQAELRRLQRLRKKGVYAPATRIPTGPDTIMVVSPYEIGPAIDHLDVEWALRQAEPAWGNITHSGEWRVPKEPTEPTDNPCYGVITEPIEVVEQAAAMLGIETRENKGGLYWVCDEADRKRLIMAAGCMSLGDFWSRVKLGWDTHWEPDEVDWFAGALV